MRIIHHINLQVLQLNMRIFHFARGPGDALKGPKSRRNHECRQKRIITPTHLRNTSANELLFYSCSLGESCGIDEA
jgi:hypothetical protein